MKSPHWPAARPFYLREQRYTAGPEMPASTSDPHFDTFGEPWPVVTWSEVTGRDLSWVEKLRIPFYDDPFLRRDRPPWVVHRWAVTSLKLRGLYPLPELPVALRGPLERGKRGSKALRKRGYIPGILHPPAPQGVVFTRYFACHITPLRLAYGDHYSIRRKAVYLVGERHRFPRAPHPLNPPAQLPVVPPALLLP